MNKNKICFNRKWRLNLHHFVMLVHGETCSFIQNIYIFVFPDIIVGNKYGAIKIA